MMNMEIAPQLHKSCTSCICSVCLIAESNGGAPGCGNCDICGGTEPCNNCKEFYVSARPVPQPCAPREEADNA